MKINDFMTALDEQKGKLLQYKNREIYRVEGIDYREGRLQLVALTSEPFESIRVDLYVFSKVMEDYKELEVVK